MTAVPATAGRDIDFYKGDSSTGVKICARTKTLTIGSESIDITQDCDDGVRRLLDKPAQKQMDASIEGIITTKELAEAALNGSVYLEGYTMVIPGFGEIACDFFLSNFELGAPYNDATTFTATLNSSGDWTYTPE